jgi:hypothetical protein
VAVVAVVAVLLVVLLLLLDVCLRVRSIYGWCCGWLMMLTVLMVVI